MLDLKPHIIEKYNNAALKVIRYYKLDGANFTFTTKNIIYVSLTKREIPNGAKVNAVLKHNYPHLLPFSELQKHLTDKYPAFPDVSICAVYFRQINDIIKKIDNELKRR